MNKSNAQNRMSMQNSAKEDVTCLRIKIPKNSEETCFTPPIKRKNICQQCIYFLYRRILNLSTPLTGVLKLSI